MSLLNRWHLVNKRGDQAVTVIPRADGTFRLVPILDYPKEETLTYEGLESYIARHELHDNRAGVQIDLFSI